MLPDAIADGLLDATLPQSAWTHAGHITACHVLVRRTDPATALELIRRSIPLLNDAHGVANTPTDGYHETLTVFYVSTVADAVARGLAIDETISALGRDAATGYWNRDVLFSEAARFGWIEPDQSAPPFALLATGAER